MNPPLPTKVFSFLFKLLSDYCTQLQLRISHLVGLALDPLPLFVAAVCVSQISPKRPRGRDQATKVRSRTPLWPAPIKTSIYAAINTNRSLFPWLACGEGGGDGEVAATTQALEKQQSSTTLKVSHSSIRTTYSLEKPQSPPCILPACLICYLPTISSCLVLRFDEAGTFNSTTFHPLQTYTSYPASIRPSVCQHASHEGC